MTQPDGDARSARAVLLAAVALHAALLAYVFPWKAFAARLPVFEYDYALHAYQVDRAASAFRAAGRLYSYDPFVLAGQPAGAVEDLTSKSLEYFVIGAEAIGVNRWVAFDLYVLGVQVAILPLGLATARLFGLTRLGAATTALLWVLLWHFDSLLHWCWYIGMISWGLAACLSVLVVALAYRALRDHDRPSYALLAPTVALVAFVHPFAVVTLGAPLLVIALRYLGACSRKEKAALVATAALAGLATLPWLLPAIRFRRYIGPVDAFLWPSPEYALFDYAGLLKDFTMTGEPVRTTFRTLVFALGGAALVRLARARDDRWVPLTVLACTSLAFAYLAGYSSALRQTQPYRQIAPAALTAAVAAALEVTELVHGARDAWTGPGRVALALVALTALPDFARTALGYVPALLPEHHLTRSAFRPGPGLHGSSLERAPRFMGHTTPAPEYAPIAERVRRLVGDRGRAVTTDWVLGEYLATFARVPTLGGIAERNVPQAAAHPLRHDLTPRHPGDDPVARYLTDYAVAVVVTKGDAPFLDARDDLLELVAVEGAFRAYRTRATPSYFAAGTGRIAEQGLDAIRVTGAGGQKVVLRFHYLDSLACRPGCTLERIDADRDPAGFIGVRNPPAEFEIYNAAR